MQSKQWWKSKVLWLNLVGLLLAIGDAVSGLNLVPPTTLVAVMAVLNAVLRFITSKPLTSTGNPVPSDLN